MKWRRENVPARILFLGRRIRFLVTIVINRKRSIFNYASLAHAIIEFLDQPDGGLV